MASWSPSGVINYIMTARNKLVWLFSGTSDGNLLGTKLVAKGFQLKIFVATEYGKQTALEQFSDESIHVGRLDEQQLHSKRNVDDPKWILDATHPFAAEISKNLINVCTKSDVPYIRFERSNEIPKEQNIYLAKNFEEAAKKAQQFGNRWLLTTGSKNLDPFLNKKNKAEIFLRMLPDPDLLKVVLGKGIPRDNIIAMQGPFSVEINTSLIENWKINCMITKASGAEGGLMRKIEAARSTGIPIIVIERPAISYPFVFHKMDPLLKYLGNETNSIQDI